MEATNRMRRIFLLFLLSVSAAIGQPFARTPLTTNGPFAPANVFVGDSMTANGYWDNGYPVVSSGIGCDYPGRMLQQSNFVHHGMYFNYASNTATVFQWVSNGFVLNSTLTNTLGDLKSHHIPTVTTVLLGANDITDVNFQALTNAYGQLYTQIKSFGSWLQVITPITNANYNAGYNTTRTNLAGWMKGLAGSLIDETFDSDQVFTNSSQFISDATHPNCTGNLNLAVYINAHTKLTNYLRTLSLDFPPLRASTLDVDFIRTRGIQVNDFLAAYPGPVPGWNGTFAFLYALDANNVQTTLRLSGQPLQLVSTTGGIQVLNSSGLEYQSPVTNIFSGTSGTQLVVNLDLGSITVFATNGFSMTNFTGLESGWGSYEKILRVDVLGCTSTPSVVSLPLFGPSFGVFVRTNVNVPGRSVTNNILYRYTWMAKGTNLTLMSTAWE